MDKGEFRASRTSLGLAQAKLADRINMSLSAVQKWEYGSVPIPYLVSYYLRNELLKQENDQDEK